MPDINDVNGSPAIETDQPLSIQEANEWALQARKEADPRKAAIEQLKCAAAQRRERKPANPLEVLKPDPHYKVGTFNAEADAFNVESSDGQKLLGKSLSNGNVRNGQKVRAFFMANNGQTLIDVKPKGRDIIIPKPDAKPPAEEPDIWVVTSCLLYSRVKNTIEKLTGNGAAQESEGETSWDAMSGVYSSPEYNSYSYGFAERLNTLGDYKTAADALENKLKPDRLIVPSGTNASAARDNAAISSNSADAVTVWFYVGEVGGFGTNLVESGNGQIFKVVGASAYPTNENTEQGPGFCMEMYRQGSLGVSLYPIVDIGEEPLSKHLIATSFPNLGGKIGYWGGIYKWHGMQDYMTGASHRTYLYREYWSGIAGVPAYTEPPETPTSFPPEYEAGVSPWPWPFEHEAWYRYGWDNQYIAAMSGGAIVADVPTITNASFGCGDAIPNDKWYWSGGIGKSAGALDRRANYSNASGMFVCWQGHKDNIGLAQSFFQAFGTYWNIPGGSTVTKLKSCNIYGCELPGGGGYPPAPPADASRFLVEAYGRKAEVWLKVCKEDYEPIELKLPFEYAAIVERLSILGGGSFGIGSGFENGKSVVRLNTYRSSTESGTTSFDDFSLDLIHATLSVDKEFAYIDIFYGGERIWENPLTRPVPFLLANQGFGSSKTGIGAGYGSDNFFHRKLGQNPQFATSYSTMIRVVNHPVDPEQTLEKYARVVKDCFTSCQSYKVRLPTKEDKTLSVVASQKYKRGETITLTANSSDNEFNNKFLICDFRTDIQDSPASVTNYKWTLPQPYYASFGGLPALSQFFDPITTSLVNFNSVPLFLKEKQHFTKMDWVFYQLQEMPRQFNPLTTTLPSGVSVRSGNIYGINVIFDLDKKFGRHARAEKIMPATSFGYSGTQNGGFSPEYSTGESFPLFISFDEQMRGNGLIENGKLAYWNRVSVSSFPTFGQLARNNS